MVNVNKEFKQANCCPTYRRPLVDLLVDGHLIKDLRRLTITVKIMAMGAACAQMPIIGSMFIVVNIK